MNRCNDCKRGFTIAFLLLLNLSVSAQIFKELSAKKDAQTQLWGYENKGKQEYWWKLAHSQGKTEELMNRGYDIEWAISPQYINIAKTFTESMAGVEIGGKVGFIDKNNRFIIKPQFEPVNKLYGFSYGLAVAKKDGKFGFINKKGEFVIPPMFDYAENFGDDLLATVKIGTKFGAIDFRGDTVVPCHYLAEEAMKILPFKNKIYREAVKVTKLRHDEGFYDTILTPINAVAQKVNEQIRDSLWLDTLQLNTCIQKEGQKYGIKAAENDTAWVLSPEYELITPLSNNYYITVKEGKKGIADAYGRIIITCRYIDISPQLEERLLVVTSSPLELFHEKSVRVGLCDLAGAMVLPSVFERIDSFKDGKAIACIAQECTELDVHGQVDDEYIDRLLNIGASKSGTDYLLFHNRLIGIRPTCAQAHNNLGVYFLEREAYKEGIRRLNLANKIAPNDSQIASNLKQAKSDRKDRRYQRVLNVLEVSGAALNLAASTYAVASGSTSGSSGSSFSSINSSSTASSSSTANSSGSTGGVKSNTSNSDRDVKWMQANYQIMKKTYGDYVSQIINMKTYPEKYSDSQRRDIQSKMSGIRKTIVGHGGTCAQSQWETWHP